MGFNSLQTGKRIWTPVVSEEIIIPARFQFPSNGKAYLNALALAVLAVGCEFQFPSNGKAYLNDSDDPYTRQDACVSIPFKRESVSELTAYANWHRHGVSFNSLQTGKRIWTNSQADRQPQHFVFQFPSNGKAYLNALIKMAVNEDPYVFQFPSNGKAYLNSRWPVSCRRIRISFNSLQTGKRIWTLWPRCRLPFVGWKFQFPSNGKAYLNPVRTTATEDEDPRFQFPSNGKAYLNGLLKGQTAA